MSSADVARALFCSLLYDTTVSGFFFFGGALRAAEAAVTPHGRQLAAVLKTTRRKSIYEFKDKEET